MWGPANTVGHVGARQSFQFFRYNTWFLKSNGALPNFLCAIYNT